MDLAWAKSSEDVLQHFAIDQDQGLSAEQAAQNVKKYGKNGEPLSYRLIFIHLT